MRQHAPNKHLLFILLIFISTFVFIGSHRQSIDKKQVNVVFRFDDYSARSSTNIELKLIDLFRKNGATITFGVIPFVSAGDVHDPSPKDIIPLTSMKRAILEAGFKQGTVDIALHGYSHQTISRKTMTEFSGLDYDNQFERLTKGKAFLEGIIGAPVTTFVPPWNTYDSNTLRALEQLGFSTLSAGISGKAIEDSNLKYLPAISELSQLRRAVHFARTSADTQPVIVVSFHEYDFVEIDEKRGNITYKEFSDLLSWLKSQKDVRFLSISQATTAITDLSAKRFLSNKWAYSLDNLLPSPLQDKDSMLLYRELAGLPIKALLRVFIFYLAIIGLGTVFSLVVAMLLFPRSTLLMNISTLGSTVLSMILFIYALRGLEIHSKAMMTTAGFVGISIGLCKSVLYFKNKQWRGDNEPVL